MISKQRITDYLIDLIKIDSISKNELNVALKLKKDMEDIGAECFFDDVGKKVKGNVGNLIVKLKGNTTDCKPFFLSSHMDTVEPGKGIKPIVANGIVKSDGTTILGSDDKSGVTIIVETLRTLKEKNLPHGDIEVAFTICEEIGLLGAKYIDESIFNSKYGIVLDSSTPDRLVLKCPASDILTIKIHGIEAHAGICPENGISSIQIASEAISKMSLGRIDEFTTANVGSISGGLATNIIPKYVKIKAEARSHDINQLDKQVEHMCSCFYSAGNNYQLTVDNKQLKPLIDIDINRIYNKMDVSSEAEITKLVDSAVDKLNYTIKHHTSGGGCDANHFNDKGIECVNLGTGMYELHTVNEYLKLSEFYRSAEIVLETIQLNTLLN